MDKKIAIVVCGIKNHIVLLNKLRARGFYTILVDGADKSLASEAADENVKVDIFDFESIKRIAIERKASLIINACQEHLNAGICKICEEIGLPYPYSYDTAMSISNKELMKQKMKENGISTTDFICVSPTDEVKDVDLKYPVYVKSCVGSGSNAVTRAENISEIEQGINKIHDKYHNSKIIIEEEARGNEYNVYCFPEDGNANVLLVARRYTDNLSADHVTKLVGTMAPPIISEEAMRNIEETANKITTAFRLDNVPMFMQVMVDGENVNVIEFAGRMAGGFGYQTILDSVGVDWFEATINSFLGVKNKIKYEKPTQYISVSHIYGYSCVFGGFRGIEKLINDGVIKHVLFPKMPGMLVKEGSANGSLIAYMIHMAPTVRELAVKIERTFDEMDFLDENGESKLNRSLLLSYDRVTE